MEKQILTATKRTVVGRKVKNLRKKGVIPANIYGKKVKSQNIEVAEKEFAQIFAKAGETGLIMLQLEGKEHPVLIHNIQIHPITRGPVHIDFFQVDLKEKVTTKVPLVIVGESKAVKDKLGVLLHILSEVEIEALPADLPEKIEVNVSNLGTIDQAVKVSQLTVSDKIKVLTDANLDIVKVAPLVSKEAEKMAKEEAEKAAAAAASAAPATETSATASPVPSAKTSETPSQPTKQ